MKRRLIVCLTVVFVFGGFLNSALAQIRVLELRNATNRNIDILAQSVDSAGKASTVYYVASIAPQRKWEQDMPIPVGDNVLLKYGELPLSATETMILRIPAPYGNEGTRLRWKVVPVGGNSIKVVRDE